MAEADAQERQPAGGGLDEGQANAGAVGVAGTGGENDAFGAARERVLDGDRIVAHHRDLGPELAQAMHQVVGEAVVIIDEQIHGISRRSEAFHVQRDGRAQGL